MAVAHIVLGGFEGGDYLSPEEKVALSNGMGFDTHVWEIGQGQAGSVSIPHRRDKP